MKLKHQMIAMAALLSFSVVAFAKEIYLYDQPKTDAKVIGTIDLAKGIVPIFTPKEGIWIKVGDPNNGNVGWVKASELNSNANSISVTQQFISSGEGPKSYKIIKIDPPQNLTEEQLKVMQRRQEVLQKAIQNMTESVNTIFQKNLNMPVNIPILVPVMVPAAPAPTQTPNAARPKAVAPVPNVDPKK